MNPCGLHLFSERDKSIADGDIMGCTKVRGSHYFLFTSTVFTDCLLTDNVILFRFSVKVSDENDFIIMWNIFKNAIESVVKGDRSFKTGGKSQIISTY